MSIPKHIKVLLGPSICRTTADDDPDNVLEFSSGQAEARLSKQLQNDKQRTVVRNTAEIKRVEGMMSRTQDADLKKELRQRIQTLADENKETERFS